MIAHEIKLNGHSLRWWWESLVLEKDGFGWWFLVSSRWVIPYSINGQLKKTFMPLRGLRQEDPLSPYIFLMCVESLSSLINNAKRRKEIQGLSVVRRGTSINHILFVNYSILFCRASKEEWWRIWSIIDKYEKASGQTINKYKFFLAQTPLQVRGNQGGGWLYLWKLWQVYWLARFNRQIKVQYLSLDQGESVAKSLQLETQVSFTSG